MSVARPALHSTDAGIEPDARRLILRELNELPDSALNRFVAAEAMFDINELDRKLAQAYGYPSGDSWLRRSDAALVSAGRQRGLAPTQPGQASSPAADMGWMAFSMTQRTTILLLNLPAPEFLRVVELALRHQLRTDTDSQLRRDRLNVVFAKRRLPYAISPDGDIAWIGEPAVAQLAIDPALSALADERLRDARREFEEARNELRAERFDDAVNDAGKAVETTMACVLTAHGHNLPRNKDGTETTQAKLVFDVLKGQGLVDSRAQYLSMAVQSFRHAGSHGAGPRPHPVDQPDAQATVAVAAVAITYFAERMPNESDSGENVPEDQAPFDR